MLWRPEDGFGGAARLVAAQFTAGDGDWIAGLAAGRAPAETVALDCEAGAGRFRCVGPGAEVTGLVEAGGEPRLRRVALDGPAAGRPARRASGCRTGASRA